MALSFPPNPVIGQQYQAPNGYTYTWDGTRWSASQGTGGSGGGSGGSGGAAIVFSNGVLVTQTATSLNFVGSVVTATNSGSAVDVNINLPATTSTLGVVKVGPSLVITQDGQLDTLSGNFWAANINVVDANQADTYWTPIGSQTDIDATILPKGTGANRASTSGNLRGQFATDWQKVLGGNDKVASGNYSIIGGGSLNKASSLHSIVVGGNNNTADSDYSVVLGGHNGNTNGITGATIIAGGTPVYSQGGVYILSAETFDDNIVQLTTDGASATSSNQITLKDNTAVYVRGMVVAKEYQKYRGEVWSWKFEGVVRRDVGSTTTDFAPSGLLPNIMLTPGTNTASNWLLTLDIDNQNGNLVVEAHGGAAQHVRWSARIDTVEVNDL
jgi:hypothetical protein